MKYKIFFIILAFGVLGVGAYFLVGKNQSVKQAAERDNIADITSNIDTLWSDMHPDSRAKWKDESEYALAVKEFSTSKYSLIVIKEIKPVSTWTNVLSGKSYTDLQAVTSTYTIENGTSHDATSYYQKLGGKWYFFSTLLSPSDRADIKNTATAGPSYKELSKNPDKFTGQKVKYSGSVVQIQEDANGGGYLRMSLSNNILDDIVWVTYSQSTDAVEGDTVTVYGFISGSTTYTSQANYQITVPGITAAVIEKQVKEAPVAVSATAHTQKLGDRVKVGTYNFTIKSVNPCVSQYDDTNKYQDKKHIAVEVSLSNSGSQSIKYNSFDFTLIDFFQDIHTTTPIFCPGNQLMSGNIASGQTVTGYIGFDIDSYADASQLIIEPLTIGSKDKYIINF